MNIHVFLRFLLVSSGIFLVGSDDFPSDEVIALTKFKEAIYEDPRLVLSSWDDLDSDPCNWNGISCSMAAGDHVLKINISGASLKGFLAPDLHLISYLEELILNGNLLMGTIPKEIGLLKNLRVLDLGNNRLTGSIPREIGNLPKIEKINLQSNGLSGRFPSELIRNLKSLEELRVDRNRLLGIVLGSNIAYPTSSVHGMYASGGNPVGVCRSSKLKVADFSYNFFVGRIPKCLSYLPKSSFQGNCLQVHDIKQRPLARCGHGGPTHKIHAPAGTKHKYGSRKPRWLFGLEVMTGIMAGTLFLAALLTTFHKFNTKSSIVIPWKKPGGIKDDHTTIYVDTEMLKDVVRYSREEVEAACEDFSNIILSSTNSLVYKGTMRGGPEIAVISVCVKEENWTAYLELYFQKEVAELVRIDHENAAKLLGYCRESSPFTRMLVFEYAPNGTLYEHLHYGEGCQLSWARRMKIVIGIAKGLKYLQTELKPPFTISQLNSNSVYLTEDFTPKLVDFESWETILSRSEKNYISSEGAICILPNSLEGRHLDFHGNLYAFGLLLLEIISGRPPYCKDKGSLLDWAREFLGDPEAMPFLVDPELKHFRREELEVVCEVIRACVCTDDTCRRGSVAADLWGLLESKIDTSISADLNGCSPSLAWAQLALSSP